MHSPEELLKHHHLSITATRLAILEAIGTHPHADAEDILKQARARSGALSKQAVYDNLHALTEKGILRAIQPKGHNTLYELSHNDNHHHIVCRACGHTEDVKCADGSAPCLSPDQSRGFALDEAEVIFWGTCPSCQSTQKSTTQKTEH